ncbi:MAG TPA: response regulator [Puia sp.]|nr:response regulator [Puia sp.]
MLSAFLIDDDPDDQDFFCLAMKGARPDANCLFADDCRCAMEKLRDSHFTPNVIFIDINMPRVSGFDCLRTLRRIPRLRLVPAYMYSTAADHHIVEQCLQLGANGFLKKQFSVAEAKRDFEQIIAKLELL